MWEIVAFQYKISELFIWYIFEIILPYIHSIKPDILWLDPDFFNISETKWFLFVVTFILSIVAFMFWRLVWKIFNFQAYQAKKYRVMLFFNIFYIIPFIYGFIWWRLNIINLFLLFLGSWSYFAFQWVLSNPNWVIDYFINQNIL